MSRRALAPLTSALLALVLGACGRVGFDGTPDGGGPGGGDGAPDGAGACAPVVGHDEDGDGVDDLCDVCPQRGSSQADEDGDGVGDDCDPDPLVAHTRTVFEPFLGPNATWMYDGRHQFLGDALRAPLDTTAVVLRLPGATSPAVFEIGGRIGARGASVDRLLSISFGPEGSPSGYYCELYDGIGGAALQLTQTDGTTYTQIDTAPIPGLIESGAFRLTMIHTPPTAACIATWDGVTYEATGSLPDLGTLQPTTFFPAFAFEVELDYAVRLDLP